MPAKFWRLTGWTNIAPRNFILSLRSIAFRICILYKLYCICICTFSSGHTGSLVVCPLTALDGVFPNLKKQTEATGWNPQQRSRMKILNLKVDIYPQTISLWLKMSGGVGVESSYPKVSKQMAAKQFSSEYHPFNW